MKGFTVPRFVFLIFALITCATACDQLPGSSRKESLDAIIAHIESDVALMSALQNCPADYYAQEGRRNSEYTDLKDQCRERPESCLKRCKRGGLSHCQSLAYLLQEGGSEPDPYSEALFAKACTRGSASACTNRAAGMTYKKTEFSFDVTECSMRTFKKTCEDDDAWGCSMYGFGLTQAGDYEPAHVRDILEKACSADPNFEACTYAQGLMQELATQ